ncbi:pyruvate kinase [Candidatus Nanohalovita haloferacivicina]|uniref:pyruvate kinase n=1 Tax=Candidatus Nanohalovita haloferacivicina TaxID=2978046 RepID=UPI00325FA4B8|nr:Pyruvate kinase [Candidatus Nanohalobia archaeon BNXNv]
MKNTKIVSTIGPATDTKEKLAEIIDSGVDVVRQNFSHVDHEQHGKIFDRIRDVSEKTAVMIDTKGPEIRLGEVEEGTELETGHNVEITTEEITGNKEKLSVNYKDFINHIEAGDEVRIDDGKIELEVEKVGETAECTVVYGGEVSSRKAVNVPGEDIGLQAPTKKDVEDIEFAAEKGYDFVSLSFVKEASDVEEVREILEEHDSDMHIISKIEHKKAVENFDEILEASDAIMVARGDLGVELPAAQLPMMQKEMIEKCNKAGKPVITATQMLESMTENPTATRAEISDVANAVLDGTDAVMLSGETAIGEYPVKTVDFMANVVEQAENSLKDITHHTVKQPPESTREIICKNVWQAGRDSDAEYLVAHTSSGSTARNIAKYRPEKPIIAFTDSEKVERQLQLAWGVQPYYEEFPSDVEGMLKASAERMKTLDLAEGDDELVFSAGIPTCVTGTTNMMQIRTVGDILN